MSKVCAKSCKTCLNKDGTFPKTEDPDIGQYLKISLIKNYKHECF